MRGQTHSARSCHGRRGSAALAAAPEALLGNVLQPHLASGHELAGPSVMVISQSCWRRPRWIGSETAVTVPDPIARRKSVLLLTPTTVPPPFADSQMWPDTLARLSTIEQYTPPCTMPQGCSSLSWIVSCARPPSG